MKLLLAFLLLAASACAQSLDTYGGVTEQPCPGGGTGNWYTAQIVKRWVLCTPLGNAFIARDVTMLAGDTSTNATYFPESFNTITAAKYPNNNTKWNVELARVASWGFNSQGLSAYPHPTDSYVTTKLPMFEFLGQANNNWLHCELHGQCKNVLNLRWPPSWPYNPATSHNITDVWEPTWQAYANAEYLTDTNIKAWVKSPYLVGLWVGNSDNCSYCSAGTDFPNQVYWPHGNYYVVGSAPHAWLNRFNSNALFTDQTNNTKAEWADWLSNPAKNASAYANIAALNAAWGTGGYYTTFGTTGTRVTGGACATGNGGASYGCTPHTNIDRYSLRINVGGTPVCADDGAGVLRGPADAACGTVTYSSGAILITKTVANGVAITVDYWHDGYGVGTGILDEPAVQTGSGFTGTAVNSWLGDPYCLNNLVDSAIGTCIAGTVTTAAYRADMDNFLQRYVTQHHAVMKTAFTGAVNAVSGHKNIMFMGISQCGQVRVPARAAVLAGAAAVNDLMEISADGSTAQLDFVTDHIGNKPYLVWYIVTANASSDMYGYAISPNKPNGATNASEVGSASVWATQALRAARYDIDVKNFWNHCNTSTGNCQFVGLDWWAFLSAGMYEHQNYGLVTWRDNAYDGIENVTASVPCAAPNAAYNCGNEQAGWYSYGNFVGPATVTNAWVDTQLVGLGKPNPPADPTAVPH